jgi:Undecaprenyl-phosphate galactose phosphotransferase WbaP
MAERSESTSELVDEVTASVKTGRAAVLSEAYTMRPTFRGVSSASSLLREPPMRTSEDAAPTERAGRHVGFQYLWQLSLTAAPLVLLDLVLLTAVFAAARQLVFLIGRAPGLDVSACFLPIAAGFLLISAELGLYPGIRLGAVEEFRRLAVAVTSIFAVWILGMAFLPVGISRDRLVYVLTAYVMYMITLLLSRGAVRSVLAKSSWWGFPALVCGNDSSVVKVYHWLAANRHLGLRPVGVIADRHELEVEGDEPWYAGSWSDTPAIAIEKGAYWAVVVPPEGAPSAFSASISEHLSTLPHVHILSELTGLPDHWSRQQPLEGLTGIHLQQNLMLPLPQITKRCMDLVGAAVGGLLLLPLLFYIAVAVKMSSRGPILYGHDRIGKDGRHFKAWKFRTMFENSSDVLEYYLEQHPELREEWGKDHKLRYDPRVTRIGRFIRKTSIDELPQLWNVLRGDMSLVGPRPIVTAEIEKYGPYFGLYTMVTPGITGLWQVSGRNNTTYEERVQLDAYYVRNWSPWMDMYLLVRTIRIVLFADGAY